MSDKHERVTAALELREPDRVPTFDLMNEFSTSNEILGKKPNPISVMIKNPYGSRLFDWLVKLPKSSYAADREMEGFAYLGAAAANKMGYDSAWITCFPVLRFLDSKKMVDIFGRMNDVVIDEKGNLANPIYREGLIDSPAAWQAWDKSDIFRLPEKVNRVFSGVNKGFGDRFYIFGFCSYGLFENIWQSMGFERFVVAARKEREFIQRLVVFYADLYCMLLEAMADAGLPGVIYTDDLGYHSGPMLNPRLVEELFGDSYRLIAETAHDLGMKIIMHSCGNVTAFLEWFADCGFDAVHPLEPTAGMELSKAKEMVGKRMCLIGNIDVTHILVDASKDEVFEAVRQAIGDAGRGGGYIVAPDHSHPTVSVERLRWMVEAVKRYGGYPLS